MKGFLVRILKIIVSGIGGLPDCEIDLPDGPIAALAGANGTGKSKLLACLLSPWTGDIPPSQEGRAAEVSVSASLSERDRAGLNQYAREAQPNHNVNLPETVTFTTRRNPLSGAQRILVPSSIALNNFAHQWQLLEAYPSLDVLYLPAERRLLPANTRGIDLNKLSGVETHQATNQARQTINQYGRLDDQEFEQFAKALSVASQLQDGPDDTHDNENTPRDMRPEWSTFADTVNGLIAPKKLLPLTRRYPENLRIETPDGHYHAVQDLSSGERQALIVISRILRAGVGHSIVLIDEPDAYLHPHLSRRLAVALEQSVGRDGQLVVATHSPAILDAISPSSIIRLSHGRAPRPVADETERLEVYRETGFRASALTQSDVLVVTEGESDVRLLSLLVPDLARGTTRAAGGRRQVLADVTRLYPYDVPVVGVIDKDVLEADVPPEVLPFIVMWDTADLEGLLLADNHALEVMIDRGLSKPEFRQVEELRAVIQRLLNAQEENVVAELTQRLLRNEDSSSWPSPKGDDPIERLRSTVRAFVSPTMEQFDVCLNQAQRLWDDASENRWGLVRGKYLLGPFSRETSNMDNGPLLLEAIARARPVLAGLEPFSTAIGAALASD